MDVLPKASGSVIHLELALKKKVFTMRMEVRARKVTMMMMTTVDMTMLRLLKLEECFA
jgi:hypothetical protein